MASSANKAKGLSKSQFLFYLISVAIIYRIVYQFFAVRFLLGAPDQDDAGFLDGCRADASSFQCAEAQLFRSWEKASSVEVESEEHLEMLSRDKTKSRTVLEGASQTTSVAPATSAEGAEVKATEATTESPEVESDFDRLYKETYAKLHVEEETYASPLSQEFEDLKQMYKTHEQKLHDIHAEHHHGHKSSVEVSPDGAMAKFEKLYQDSLASISSHAHDPSPFADSLAGMQSDLEARQKALEYSHSHTHSRLRSGATSATTTTAPPSQTHGDLMERIQSFGHDLCELPEHRKLAACAQFLASVSVAKEDEQHLMAAATVPSDREAHFAEFDRHFCEDARHSESKHCRELLVSGKLHSAAPATSTTVLPSVAPRKFLAPSENELQWAKVTARASAQGSKGGSLLALSSDELRHLRFGMRWQGKVPKVACVAPIPSTAASRTQMRYFVDNFKLQHYDGEKELILVYRHKDEEVGKIAKEMENGHDVRAVAVFEDGDFPSTTAFRYGAWSAKDADVVARWNYDEWYAPQRLSSQVRAMAQTARPACLLKFWTVLAGTGKELLSTRGGPGWEGSIVGEAQWMREHWMPLVEGERALLMDLHKQNIVQVSEPGLLVYNAEADHYMDAVWSHFHVVVA